MSALPSAAELLDRAYVVALPLTVRFRGLDVREAMILEGPSGWTEFSPFTEYDDDESAAWLRAAIDFGWRTRPPRLRERIPVNATVPAVPAEAVPAVLTRFPGCRTAKVKVSERGQTLADDVARVQAVRAILGPEGRIRVDANGGWNVDEAEHAIHELAPFDLEYVEQPCASVEELRQVRERVGYLSIPIAADESVRKAADPLAVARAGAADLLVVKAQPLGGVHRTLRIRAETGLPVVVSSALESSIGLSMGAALAAALPSLDYDCGLGTGSLLAADVTDTPLRPEGGSITAAPIAASETLLRARAVDDARAHWWHERLRRCRDLLEDGVSRDPAGSRPAEPPLDPR